MKSLIMISFMPTAFYITTSAISTADIVAREFIPWETENDLNLEMELDQCLEINLFNPSPQNSYPS